MKKYSFREVSKRDKKKFAPKVEHMFSAEFLNEKLNVL